MTNDQLIAKYNPANSHNLTQADLAEMRKLTDDQLKVLAEAFPDKGANNKQYLLLYDSRVPDKKQLYNKSTWPKIYNLRRMNNLKHWQPFSFWDIFTRPRFKPMDSVSTTNPNLVKSTRRVMDLSADEASKQLRDAIKDNQDKKTTKKPDAKPAKPAEAAKKQEAGKSAAKPAAKPTGAVKPIKPTGAVQTAEVQQPAATDLPADQQFGDPDDDGGEEQQPE